MAAPAVVEGEVMATPAATAVDEATAATQEEEEVGILGRCKGVDSQCQASHTAGMLAHV